MKKLLLVDDEPNIVMSLEYAFKKQGYTVYIARDGSEALHSMAEAVPDVVILDIMMPQVDGYETLRIIRSTPEYADVKVIFLTAKSKTSDVEKGLAMGADLYFTKPFSVKKLIAAVGELVAQGA